MARSCPDLALALDQVAPRSERPSETTPRGVLFVGLLLGLPAPIFTLRLLLLTFVRAVFDAYGSVLTEFGSPELTHE